MPSALIHPVAHMPAGGECVHDLIGHDAHGVEGRHASQYVDEMLLVGVVEGAVRGVADRPVVAVVPCVPVFGLESGMSHGGLLSQGDRDVYLIGLGRRVRDSS
jgi:hypothetical protein